MAQPLFVTRPISLSSDYPILIVDREGELGYSLAHILHPSFLPIVVSQKEKKREGIVYHPYTKRLRLPQNHFSHIIIFYNGEKEILSDLPPFLKKAQELKAKCIFVTSMYLVTEQLIEKIRPYPRSSILIYGDLFPAEKTPSTTSRLLKSAKDHQQIVLSQLGLTPCYPLALPDLLSTVLDTMLNEVKGHTFFVASNEKTELAFTRMIQRIEPMVKVDFTKKASPQKKYLIPKEAIHFHPARSLEERIREYLIEEKNAPEVFFPEVKKRKRKLPSFVLKTMTMLLALFILPVLLFFLGTVVGFGGIGVSAYLLEKGDTTLSKDVGGIALSAFHLASPSEQMLRGFLRTFGLILPQEHFLIQASSGEEVASLLVSTATAMSDVEASLKGEKEVSPETIKGSLKKAAILLQSLMAKEVFPIVYQERLHQKERSISLLTNLIDVTPQLLGFEGKKTYLFLLQDNLELRSGGGFVKALALVTLKDGKVSPFQLIDVYEADAKLTGHLPPPYILKRHLTSAHWFLRDSSMSLDSQVNATTAAQFVRLELGERVDGVVSMDLSFLRMLLSLSGPLDLPDYHTTLTKENMYEEIISHNQDALWKEDEKKKDFLLSFAEAVKDRMTKKPPSPLALLEIITEAIYQKHLLVTSLDPQLLPVFLRNHLVSSPLLSTNSDFFSVIENNIGANKANYFIKRRFVHRIDLRPEGRASESVTLSYKNTSQKEEGEYEAYVQLVVPKTAQLEGITINGTAQEILSAITDPAIYTKSTFKEPQGLEVQEEEAFGKKIIGFPLRVKAGEERKVSVVYSIDSPLKERGGRGSYEMSFFKQPGVDQDDYTLELLYPSSLEAVKAPFQTQQRKNTLYLQKEMTEDEVFSFEFVRR